MGTVEDVRKLLQDLVTPDLKALDARVTALEKKMDLRFEAVELKLDALDKKFELKLDALDKKLDLKTDLLDRKIDFKFDLLMAEIRGLALVVASNHASILHALDLDRRLERIENERAFKTAQTTATTAPHRLSDVSESSL
jgi:hypothetical protein